MRHLTRAAFFFTACLCLTAPLCAAHNATPTPVVATSDIEIIVLEAPGCIYCRHFKKEIAPIYQTSKYTKNVPLIYLDVNDAKTGKLNLSKPVGIVPTIIILENRQEIGRTHGYVSRQDFFRIIKHILAGR